MANQETKLVDDIIASRRSLLFGGAAAIATMALPKSASAYTTPTSFTDNDILNFALNLEYLESNFYYLAAFGCTINAPNAAAIAAGAPSAGIPITGTGTQGTVNAGTTTPVPFTTVQAASYATEVAIEEGKHVLFLQSVLGSYGVAQPAINLSVAGFTTVANAAGITGSFNPFANDADFLVGSYIFEDVGVTAYHGAAPLISTTTTGKTILSAAVGIHAVEAYHAGLIRTTLLALDPTGSLGLLGYTQKISALRSTLALQIPQTSTAITQELDPTPDDYGVSDGTFTVSLGSSTGTVPRTNIVDAVPNYILGVSRSTSQILNIVTAGGATTAGSVSTGGFFPNGLNGLFQ
jgi:hypothetical protein